MDLGLGGKVALVMGSSAGIGLGVAEALAREEARVAVVSRSRGRAEEAAATIARADAPTSDGGIAGEAAPFVADATDLDRLARLPAEVEAALGPIEILVANTGVPPPGRSCRPDDWAAPRSTATSSPSSAPGAPPTSPAP